MDTWDRPLLGNYILALSSSKLTEWSRSSEMSCAPLLRVVLALLSLDTFRCVLFRSEIRARNSETTGTDADLLYVGRMLNQALREVMLGGWHFLSRVDSSKGPKPVK